MKRKKKQAPKLLNQLCLFSEFEMQAMTENPVKPAAAADPVKLFDLSWLMWQMQIAEGLRGRAWREIRSMLIAKRPAGLIKTKTGPLVRGAPGLLV